MRSWRSSTAWPASSRTSASSRSSRPRTSPISARPSIRSISTIRSSSYIVEIVHATRQPADFGLNLGPYIQYGASPRATIFLTRGASGQAFLEGRSYVTPQDIKTIGHDVLRHRVTVTYEAEAEEITSEQLLQRIFDRSRYPRPADAGNPKFESRNPKQIPITKYRNGIGSFGIRISGLFRISRFEFRI